MEGDTKMDTTIATALFLCLRTAPPSNYGISLCKDRRSSDLIAF